MCILQYVKLMWCSGIPHFYDQLEGAAHLVGTGHVNMSECQDDLMSVPLLATRCLNFKFMQHVVVFQKSIVKWGRHLPWVDVHSAMCETYVV